MTWRRAILAFVTAAIVAEFTGASAILIVTFDFETVGLGLLVPLFLVPSAALYLICETVSGWSGYSHWSYFAPFLACEVWFIGMGATAPEGSGFAFYMAIVLAASAIAVYASFGSRHKLSMRV